MNIRNKKRKYCKENFLIGEQQIDVLRKGSFTVEISMVMSLILFVILAVIYLCFFVHNRTWLTAAAYEASLTGNMESVKKNANVYDVTLEKSEELGNIGFLGAENILVNVDVGKKVSVIYDLDMVNDWGNLEWHITAQGSTKILDPVKRIRQIKAAADIVDSIGVLE